MDDRQAGNRDYSGKSWHSGGGNQQRDFNDAQHDNRRGGRGREDQHRSQWQGRRDHRGQEDFQRNRGSWQNQDRRPQNERNNDSRGERNSGGSHRRSRSRTPERLDLQHSPNLERERETGIPFKYGSDRRNFDNRRHFDDRDSLRGGKSKQQERREKFERMGPSSEDLSKIPAYINPRAVNVNKVIEQQEKRKLLWGKKAKSETEETAAEEPLAPVKPTAAVWQNVTFSGDTDGSVANKFKKLMGLKNADGTPKSGTGSAVGTEEASSSSQPALVKQDDLFRNLDRQYEMARLSAHTQKGVGLGFGSR